MFPVFLNGPENKPRPGLPQQRFQFAGVAGDLDGFPGQRRCVRQLILQVLPVCDHDDFETAQFRVGSEFENQKHHRQTFTTALGMPDNPAPPVVLAIFRTSFTGFQTLDGPDDGPILLIPAHQFDGLPAHGHEQRKVTDDIQQVGGS